MPGNILVHLNAFTAPAASLSGLLWIMIKIEHLQTKLGTVPVRCEQLGNDYVVLNVDGESVKHSLR